MLKRKRKILVVATGGTISMSPTEDGSFIPKLSGQDIVELVPGISKFADIDVYQFCNLPSPSITPEMMFDLYKFVAEQIEIYDGIVITHGTDTVEETSYLLYLTLQTKKPVVFTAAMRANEEVGIDGPRNLLDAVRVASDPNSYDRGVMLVISDQIFCVREVYKTSTSMTYAFGAPNYGLLGVIDNDSVIFYRKPEIREKYKVDKIETNIDIIKLCSGMGRKFIDCAINAGVKGLVIEAFGRGNVTPEVEDGIRDAIDTGLPIVLTSRVPNGRVLGVYGYKGGGKRLEDMGVIMGSDLNSEKARLKLMVLLGAGMTTEEIRHCFLYNDYMLHNKSTDLEINSEEFSDEL